MRISDWSSDVCSSDLVLIVTLAETTPVLEAANLQDDLRRAGIEPWAWIVNNSVAAAHPHSPLLRQRARNELREIDAVATQHARRHAVVPLLTEEPVGRSEEHTSALQSLMRTSYAVFCLTKKKTYKSTLTQY